MEMPEQSQKHLKFGCDLDILLLWIFYFIKAWQINACFDTTCTASIGLFWQINTI